MTIDAANAGLAVEEIELDLEHRATGRDLRGFVHRGRQLVDLVLANGPQGLNFRGLRLPLVGWVVGVAVPSVAPVAAIGLADDLWSGPERGFRAHLRGGATTGTSKLIAIPLWGLVRTRSLSVRCSWASRRTHSTSSTPSPVARSRRSCSARSRSAAGRAAGSRSAVLLAPYDLREMTMLGDAGANALGAVLGLRSVSRLTGRRRWFAISALAALTASASVARSAR